MTAPTSTPAAPARAAEALTGRGRWLGMVIISLGVSLIIIDATIVNVLLPKIVTGLDLRTTDAEWITSVYSLVFAALLISFGRAGDLFGRRRLFVLGTSIFMLASLLAARSGSGPELIASRALQGVGASMILPATLSTVNTVFTGRDRHIAFGIWGSLIGGMAAVGPLLGGWLATSYGWRWAFTINIPLGLVIIAGALRWVPETKEPRSPRPNTGGAGGQEAKLIAGGKGSVPDAGGKGSVPNAGGKRSVPNAGGGAGAQRAEWELSREIDWVGGVLSALGLGSVVFALIEGQRYGWWVVTRPFTLGTWHWPISGVSPVPVALVTGLILIVALVLVEQAKAAAGKPVVLDLSLFRIPSFRRGNAAASLISVGELGLLFVLPLFLQNVHGNSPLQVCVAIVPLAIGSFLAGPFAGRLSHRVGAPRVVQLGMALEVVAVLAIGLTTSAATTGLDLAPWMLVYGVGLGLTSAQLTNVSLGDVPHAKSGQASGTQSTARQIGSALGIALIGTVFATSMDHVMRDELQRTAIPASQHAALAHQLRESAGTYAQTAKLTGEAAHAADQALAVAADRAILTTAAILLLGLLLTLRLRRSLPDPSAPGRSAPERSIPERSVPDVSQTTDSGQRE